MEQCFGGRYAVRASVLAMSGGNLYVAEDLSLQRRVLVYVPEGKYADDETRTAMLRAAGFVHDDFMHLLDVGTSLGNPYAVFKWYEGPPLIRQLRKHRMTADGILASLYQLGQAMREAAEEGMSGYSVLADNLWFGHGGRLLPIRYWEGAADHAKGAVGLCSLLVQLCTKEETLPETPDMAEQRLRLALHELPAARLEAVIALIVRSFREKPALMAFLSELRLCLPPSSPSASSAAAAGSRLPQPPASHTAALTADDEFFDAAKAETDAMDNEEDAPAGRSRVWRRLTIVAGAACLFVAVFIGVLTFIFQLGERGSTVTETRPPQHEAAVDASATGSPAKPAPGQPAAADSAPAQTDTGSGAPASGPTTIPKLVGLSHADAEKAALAAGLHYTFYLESNAAAQGKVFKQEPQSGAAASRGDSITFWVSKGK